MKKMKHWVISDTHFGHNKLVKEGHRPQDFEATILDNLSYIGEEDILYHLGDFCFYKDVLWHDHFMEKCPAKKNILILGNHDRNTVGWYYKNGWDCVCHEMTLMMFGWKIILTHVPICEAEFMGHGVNTINVHGHVHNLNHRNAILTPQHFAVVMEHNYEPLILRKLIGM